MTKTSSFAEIYADYIEANRDTVDSANLLFLTDDKNVADDETVIDARKGRYALELAVVCGLYYEPGCGGLPTMDYEYHDVDITAQLAEQIMAADRNKTYLDTNGRLVVVHGVPRGLIPSDLLARQWTTKFEDWYEMTTGLALGED